MKRVRFILLLVAVVFMASAISVYAQKVENGTFSGTYIPQKADGSLQFAVLSDVHISLGSASVKGTEACVEDINKNPNIQFVMITGDIANFGSDDEIKSAKRIFDAIKVPWFIIPGNHDATWSESGTNSFTKIFGYERFEFEAGKFKFLGVPCGPNIRMAPALVPRESMLWLKDEVNALPEDKPLFFVTHYPLDSSLIKYDDVLNTIKSRNIQLVFSGHWHQDRAMVYDGVPGVIVRSTLATSKGDVGYVIATIKGSVITFQDKIVGKKEPGKIWYTVRMSNGPAYPDNVEYPQPVNDYNVRFPQVTQVWRYENNADVGSGAAIWRKGKMVMPKEGVNALPSVANAVQKGDIVIFADEAGMIYGLDATSGDKLWSFKTDGKTFSTPAVSGDYVVVGSSDNNIYCLNPKDGSLRWKYTCNKSVLGTANIYNGVVYIGTSDNVFRALDLKTGKLKWSYDKMKSFVVSRPYVDKQQVVIGDWGNTLYSFNHKDGKLQWEWMTKIKVRNYSPAQVWPVKSKGYLMITIPDRCSYVLDAKTGKQIAKVYGGREAVGLSPNGEEYYIKNMKDTVRAYSLDKILSKADNGAQLNAQDVKTWQTITEYGYEIGPTPIIATPTGGKDGKGLVFIATSRGCIFALRVSDGAVEWQHEVSKALVNYILPIGEHQLLVSTMDGVITLLSY